ncbi:unnamed protein product [Microthlaspi erraticum]|uniref:Uncharacterized protein n=1 Tax=Microthlaspi erraticum TaxID=1685480 RepID=A0A6D2KHX1_9BRAS|nr:unnamed protein product [Microthlaspi erraticum]
MKTKHSPEKDDPINGFCKATSESRETALFFLEGFSWDLDNAVSGFLQGLLPPVQKPPLQRSRSRSPSRRIYSPASALKLNLEDSREPIRLAKDATHHDGKILVSTADALNYVFQDKEEEGSAHR